MTDIITPAFETPSLSFSPIVSAALAAGATVRPHPTDNLKILVSIAEKENAAKFESGALAILPAVQISLGMQFSSQMVAWGLSLLTPAATTWALGWIVGITLKNALWRMAANHHTRPFLMQKSKVLHQRHGSKMPVGSRSIANVPYAWRT